nr:MAG TPA: hypothetical protein [Bacteriophage sp.]
MTSCRNNSNRFSYSRTIFKSKNKIFRSADIRFLRISVFYIVIRSIISSRYLIFSSF